MGAAADWVEPCTGLMMKACGARGQQGAPPSPVVTRRARAARAGAMGLLRLLQYAPRGTHLALLGQEEGVGGLVLAPAELGGPATGGEGGWEAARVEGSPPPA